MELIDNRFITYNGYIAFHHTTDMPCLKIRHIPFEVHNCYELYYLKHGKSQYMIESKQYNVNEGEILLVNKNEFHSVTVDLEKGYDRYVFQFTTYPFLADQKIIELFNRLLQTSNRIVSAELVKKYNLIHYFEELERIGLENDCKSMNFEPIKRDATPKDILFSGKITAILYMLLASIIENLTTKDLVPSAQKETAQTLIDKILQHIYSTIERPFSLDDMAKHLFVSKFYLCREFTKYMNLSPKKYVLIKKILLARNLINEGMPAMEVALKLGFSNYSTFFYNYVNIIGTSPSENIEDRTIESYMQKKEIETVYTKTSSQKRNPYKMQFVPIDNL